MNAPNCLVCGAALEARPYKAGLYLQCPRKCIQVFPKNAAARAAFKERYAEASPPPAPAKVAGAGSPAPAPAARGVERPVPESGPRRGLSLDELYS